jgi:hypothetical protein
MQSSSDDVGPGPDSEENMFVPAGYTYFGQFVDHDLTRDTTSTFDGSNAPTNQRTPRFDLDCVYGRGPVDDPNMYEADGATLSLGKVVDADSGRKDLLRDSSDKAIIGDPRNDENSIVSQIQASMIRLHNNKVAALKAAGKTGADLFNAARNETRWEYQLVLVEDYLKRIVDGQQVAQFDQLRKPGARGKSQDDGAYLLYPPENRAALPIEFAGAAYRFGHSMVRNGYFLQDKESFPIFDGAGTANSLVGFEALLPTHVIKDWRRFFPDATREGADPFSPAPGQTAGNNGKNDSADDAPGKPRLQFAYRIDPSVVDPLSALPAVVVDDPPPSLMVRNLWRGAAFMLPTGQDFARKLNIAPLDKKYLVARQELKQPSAAGEKQFQYVPIDANLQAATPLWFYILAEAQKSMVDRFAGTVFNETDMKDAAAATGAQLGAVGGRIVLEVFHGLLDSDPDSYRNHPDAANWRSAFASSRAWFVVTS